MSWDDDNDDSDDPRRRMRRWAGDFLPDEIFKEIEEMMKKMLEEIGQQPNLDMDAMKKMLEDSKNLNPFVFGFQVRVGPDGKPVIQRFGNRPQGMPGSEAQLPVLEPLVDVIEEEDEVVVVAELPGVEREQIKVRVKGQTLLIDVDNPERPYHKELELPVTVKKDGAKSSVRNGVLEVRLKKA
jgi:HSP20 family protein